MRFQAHVPMQVSSELPLPPVQDDTLCHVLNHLWNCANKSTAMYLAADAFPGPDYFNTLPLSYDVWKRSRYPVLERNTFLTQVIKYGRPFQNHKISKVLDCDVVAIPRTVRIHLELRDRFDFSHQDVCENTKHQTPNNTQQTTNTNSAQIS